ncbi:MAG TPA: vitamin B12 dependent-methionine synthase activation domain-containing protein [Phycisphaerae bacterium]|nr:vitamin B12 dependent-methionine synthase activation domain-containing protein [Phycisphaerae bacterium]
MMLGRTGLFTAAMQRTVDLKLDISVRDVLRTLGNANGEPVRRDIVDMVSRLLSESANCLRVRGVYVIRKVVRLTPMVLELEGGTLFQSSIAGFLRPAKRAAVFVVTVGDGIERAAQQRRADGQEAESFVLHAIGSTAADAACDAIIEYLWAHETSGDEAVTAPFSPGYCGFPLTEQHKLFSALDTSPISVTLLPSMMMSPVKSVSGLAGIGDARQVEAHGIPCENCNENCGMRRRLR